jgi:hypothetical protein
MPGRSTETTTEEIIMMTLTPAYGRDYNSVKAVKKAFDDGLDFIVNDISSPWDGKYTSKYELARCRIDRVMIRYGKLRKIAPFSCTR